MLLECHAGGSYVTVTVTVQANYSVKHGIARPVMTMKHVLCHIPDGDPRFQEIIEKLSRHSLS